MKFEDYRKELQQNAEYLEAEQELKPLLDLADEILSLRLEKGWSQSELARRTGTKQSNISKIESGLTNPTIKFIQKVADAFDMELVIQLHKKAPDPMPVSAELMTASSDGTPREKTEDNLITATTN